MADPERVQGGSEQIISFVQGYSKNERSSANRPLSNLSESPLGVVDPPLNKKAYVDISDFTGKPVKANGFNYPRGV